MGDQAVGLAEERIVPTNAKRRIARPQSCLPVAAESKLVGSRGVVEQANVRGSDPAVETRGKAVHADVHHLAPAADLLGDPRFDGLAMREVVPGEEGGTLASVERLRELREQLRMSNRTVQVDQKSGYAALEKRRSEGPVQDAGQGESSQVATPVSPERRTR